MRTVAAVFKGGETIVTPGTCEVNAAGRNTFFTGKAAVPEQEPFLLFQTVSRCGDITDVPGVIQGTDLAVFEVRISAPEDEVYSTFYTAVGEALAHMSALQ